MKRILISLALLLCCPWHANAAIQTWTSGDPLSEVRTKILANDAELYGYKVASGAVSGSTLTLTLADASTVVVNVATLVNTDAQTITNLSLNATTNVLTVALSGGNTATVDLTGLITKALTINAAGFDGNLDSDVDTLQELAQVVDDLEIGEGGGATAINDLTDVDTTGKATGKVLKFDSSGNLIVGDDEIGAAGTGDITGVTAGTGLTGGGDTGAVTVGLSQATQDAIAANTAKISFDSTSSARLANTNGTNTGDNATNTQYSGLITSKTANYVLAAPNGSAGTPSFRALVAADIPALSYQAPLTNPLIAAGTQALTADWDVGAYQIRALTFYSDVATGTAPFTVASTTAVANLNASLLEGHAASYFQTALTNPVVQANLGTGVYTFLGTPTAANFFSAVTDEGAFAATLFGYADAATAFAGIKQAATESATGVVELATTSEATTGTDTARAVTPAGVKAVTDQFWSAGTDGTRRITFGNNPSGIAPTASVYEQYVDNGVWKLNTSGTESYMMTSSTGPVAMVGNSGGASHITVPNGTVNLATGTVAVVDGAIGNASATSLSFGADPADAGAIRLSNNTAIYWEAATPGTDIPIAVDGSNIIQMGQNSAGINFNSAPITGAVIGGASTFGGTGSIATTGTIQGAIVISTDADGMTGAEMTTAGMYGTLFVATGAGTWTLPTAVTGMSGCLKDTGTNHDLILDVQATDNIQIPGAAEQADGVGITNAATTTFGDQVCFVAISSGHWVTTGMGGVWASQ